MSRTLRRDYRTRFQARTVQRRDCSCWFCSPHKRRGPGAPRVPTLDERSAAKAEREQLQEPTQ